jgi:hypothetical protein
MKAAIDASIWSPTVTSRFYWTAMASPGHRRDPALVAAAADAVG